jgi:tetratricopeptide (TPR) repeat protein
MGRSRRRQRQVEAPGSDAESAPAVETLAPTYVPMPAQPAWAADVEAPALPLEGLEPWGPIRGPALALEEPEMDDATTCDSGDPAQLVLDAAPAIELPARPSGDAAAVNDDLATVLHGAVPVADLELELVTAAPPAEAEAVEAEPAAEPVEVEPEPEPDPVELLYAQARQAADAGDVAGAKSLYRELLAARPGHVRARNNLALLLDAGGDHAAALAELDRALDIEEENATLLTNRGALLGAMGRFAAAERDLKRVLRVDPAQAEALFNLGVVMTKKGLWAEAVPHLRRAIELEPGRGAAHFYLGEALNHVDDLHGAMAAYQRAAELQPHNPRALYGLGIVYDRLGRPDDAAQMYRRSREVGRR